MDDIDNLVLGTSTEVDIDAGLLRVGASTGCSGIGSRKRVLVQTFNVVNVQASFE